MAKNKEWIFTKADGTQTKVVLIKNRRVTVDDGMEMKIDNFKTPESNFMEKVYDIQLGNGEVAKLCIKNKPILTYYGKNVETGEDYAPMKLPKWTYVFVALYAINFFIILGGALGGALAAMGATLSATIAAKNDKPTGVKATLCTLLYVAITAVSLAIAVFAYNTLHKMG
ncbi:MAG: hypothetical protein J5802_07630 [Butyrivibrio sp.]|nr:hypothetical protein [Butyrivibrio sp.]